MFEKRWEGYFWHHTWRLLPEHFQMSYRFGNFETLIGIPIFWVEFVKFEVGEGRRGVEEVGGGFEGAAMESEVGEGTGEVMEGEGVRVSVEEAKGGWEVVQVLYEQRAQVEGGEGWGEIVYVFVEVNAKVKKSEVLGEVVHVFVERGAEREVGECRRKIADVLVEVVSQREVGEGRREVVDGLVE